MTEVIVWHNHVMRKELRTRAEGGALVFEYRLNEGKWRETHRMVWPEPKRNWLQKVLGALK